MAQTQEKDPMRERVTEFIQVLKRAPPFAAANTARGICTFLLSEVNLQHIKDFTDDRGVNNNSLYRDMRNNHQQFRDNVERLGAASLAMGMSSLPGDEYGFSASANRGKAIPTANSSLTNIVPFLIEAHIDNELNKAALAQLRHLANNDRFKQIYIEMLSSEAVQFTIEEDSSLPFGGSNYRSNLLYVYEYFRTGSTPYLHGSVPNTGEAHQSFADIVKTWLKQIQAPTESATFSEVFNRVLAAQTHTQAPESAVKDWSKFTQHLMEIVLPTDIIYLPNMDMASGMPYLAETVLSSVAPELMQNQAIKSKILTSIPQQTLSFAQEIWIDWEKETTILGQAAYRSIQTDTIGEAFRGSVWQGADLPEASHMVRDHQFGVAISAAQIRCKDVDVWNRRDGKLRPAEDTRYSAGVVHESKHDGVRFWQEDLEKQPPSCFLAGTFVHTHDGSRPIETLQENDRVLTRADTGEWGVVSDERVQIPCKDGVVTVYGINDEPAFFTPNHPFVDKFGLVRAIDPAAAHRENPWLEVGTLKVGHVLLRTTDGVTYEEVPIHTLKRAEVAVDYVYGVHLREGLRNYHANGYLVRMNYPEITIKSLADALRQIPAQEQLRMLGHLQELQPLLSRFGQGTVMGLLTSELRKSDVELGDMKTKKPPGPKVPGLYFQSRSFSLSADSHSIEKLAQDYVLPAIDCLEGQVWINGEACPRARVLKRGFVWSRLLTTSLWEHGMCTFGADHDMVAGDGFIWLDNDPSPQQPGPDAVQFQAQTVLLREYYEQPQGDGSIAYVVAEAVYAVKEASAELNELVVQTNDFQLEENVESEEDQALLSITDAVVPTAEFEQRQKAVRKIDGPTLSVPSDAAQEAVETFDIIYDFNTAFDPPTSRPPVKVFQVQKVRKAVANGVQRFDFTIPALDKLAEKLNKSTPDSLQSQSFYETMVLPTEQNERCIEITINAPERLALVADDNVNAATYGDTAKSYKELKYTQLGITEEELKIPFVPSKLVLNTNTLEGLVSGQWIEFDPDAVGDDGKWHTVTGSRQKPTVPVSPPQPHSGETTTGVKPPVFLPPLTRSKQDLMTGFAINTMELKKDTQNLLRVVMHYHMDEDDRKGILGIEHKPTVTSLASYGPDELPSDVADELDADISSWIKNTYAPSWIAENASTLTPEQQRAFNIQVDLVWQRRLKYFREGSGKHCLSRCKEYNLLNTQLATLAFRRRYPRIMTYIQDKTQVTTESTDEKLKGMIGGKKWAHLLFEGLMTTDMIGQIARESQLAETTKINTLEMYLLNALWRQDTGHEELGTMTQQLCNAVRASLRDQNLFKSRCIDDPKQLEDGIRDYLRELFILLLDEEAAKATGITADFRKAMIDSMKAHCKWDDDYAKRTARQNAEAMLLAASSAIKNAASYATSAAESPETFRSGAKGVARFFNWFRRFRSGIKGDYTGIGSPPEVKFEPRPGTGIICFGLGLAMTMVYIKQSWQSWGQWIENDETKPLTGLEKTRLVASALQAFGGLVFSTYKSVQLAKGWDPGNVSKVGELTHSASLNLEMAVVSRSMHMHPDIVLEQTDFAKRARRNAVASRDLALGTKKARSIQAAMLPDSVKPKLWKDRIISFKDSAKSRIKGWGQAIKARCKFNMTETFLRGFSAAMSLTMLVLSCITAAQLWADQELGERFMAVFNLVVQFANLIVEAAVLLFAVPVYIGLAILLISTLVQVLFSIFYTPKAPKARIQKWWESNKPKSNGFFDRLPEDPSSTLQYSINQTKVIPGADTSLIITGSKRAQDPETGHKRLRSISVRYSAAQSATAKFLFDTKKQALAEVISSSADPAPGESCIILPPSLQTVFKTESALEKSVYPCGLAPIGTGISSQSYDLGVEVDPTAVADKTPLPSISLASGEQLVFKIRGVIAQPAPKNEADKTDYSKSTPPWKKFEVRITETYADEMDEITGHHEVVFEIEKI
ncbi:hypothetical protein V8C42DRAFT_364147 [Trichoderma barbatum]